VFGDFTAGQGEDFLDEFIDVKTRLFRRRFPGQRPQPGDDAACMVCAIDYARDRVAYFIELRNLTIKPSEAGIAIGDDCGEGWFTS
jgi:hypothetical protein